MGLFRKIRGRKQLSGPQADKQEDREYRLKWGYCLCEINPPHNAEYHDKVVRIKKENPGQHWVVEAGVPYAVEAEDLIRELNNE